MFAQKQKQDLLESGGLTGRWMTREKSKLWSKADLTLMPALGELKATESLNHVTGCTAGRSRETGQNSEIL